MENPLQPGARGERLPDRENVLRFIRGSKDGRASEAAFILVEWFLAAVTIIAAGAFSIRLAVRFVNDRAMSASHSGIRYSPDVIKRRLKWFRLAFAVALGGIALVMMRFDGPADMVDASVLGILSVLGIVGELRRQD